MSKTPEEMAEEYADDYGWESIVNEFKNDSIKAYIAGYKAGFETAIRQRMDAAIQKMRDNVFNAFYPLEEE